MPAALVLTYAVVGGLLIGSFLTVVVGRVPDGGSVVRPPSRCDECGTRLGPRELVPVFSWLALRGRCRHCGVAIGPQALWIELATAAVFALMVARFGADIAVVPFCVFGAVLVAQTAIDLRVQRLPREITYVGLALGAPLLVVAALVRDEPRRIGTMLLGALIALALMGAIYVASRGGMGDGDVRFAPLLGLFLGWLNPGIVPLGLFFGSILGAVVGVALMAAGQAGRRTAVPFGPFLAAGSLVAMFVGQPFIDVLLAR